MISFLDGEIVEVLGPHAADVRKREPRIVGLRIRVDTGGAQAVTAKRWDELGCR